MSKTIIIGSVEQIPPGEGRNFVVDDAQIAVFRTHAGEIYATQAACPHRNGPLADGLLGGAILVCPLHDRSFDLRTGEGNGPDCMNLKTYPITVVDNAQIQITL
jgi:nitrite reductase (NADH) small subunit